jgi:hypothetical protein
VVHHGFGQRQGPAHDGQLGLGLDLAQALHQPLQGLPGHLEPGVGHGLGQALVLLVGKMHRFKTQAAHLKSLEVLPQGIRQVDLVDAHLTLLRFLLGPGLVAEISQEHSRLSGNQDHAPTRVRGGKAAQIAAVLGAGHEKGVNLMCRQQLPEGRQTEVHGVSHHKL